MQTILHKLLYEQDYGRDTVLVTVIRERGSAPRGTGASMLVGGKGRLTGSIGGGAVERNSETFALELLRDRRSSERCFALHPASENDIGMVCGGDVDVFFRFIAHDDAVWNGIAKQALDRFAERKTGCVLLSLSGEADSFGVGVAAGFSADGTRFGILVSPGERAILFGAGHIARALAPLLDSVGFRVTVIDPRPELAVPDAFPSAERVIAGDLERLSDLVTVTADDYLVVMTHGHTYDYIVQNQILRGPFAYCGVIGSASKRAVVNAKLLEAGIPASAIERVHSPIGLAIKAITPEEIAVSIAAEMILCRAAAREAAGTNEK